MEGYKEGDKIVRCTACRSTEFTGKDGKKVVVKNKTTLPVHYQHFLDLFNPNSGWIVKRCKGSGQKQVTSTYTKVPSPSKRYPNAYAFKFVTDTEA